MQICAWQFNIWSSFKWSCKWDIIIWVGRCILSSLQIMACRRRVVYLIGISISGYVNCGEMERAPFSFVLLKRNNRLSHSNLKYAFLYLWNVHLHFLFEYIIKEMQMWKCTVSIHGYSRVVFVWLCFVWRKN